MKNILYVFIISCLFFACESCKKEKSPLEQLPDAHNSDRLSVFGCLVNGEVWVPSTGINTITYTYHEPTGGFSLAAKNKNNSADIWEMIGLATTFLDIGNYSQENDLPYIDFGECLDFPEYSLDTLSPNWVNIDYFSKDEGVIIGTFEFTGINSDCLSDTVRITDGRFKATYK